MDVQLAFDDGAVVWAAPKGQREFEALGQRLVRCGLLTQERLTQLLGESEASARSLPALIRAERVLSDGDLDEVGDLLTKETIFDVLRWKRGAFHFSAQTVVHDHPPEKLLAAEQILMDGLRMVDEWETFQAIVPSEQTILERRGSPEDYRRKAHSELRCRPEEADKIFQLVDGRLTLQRVIDLSRIGVFDATRTIAELIQADLIAPVEGVGAAAMSRAVGTGRSFVEAARFVALATLPLLLLASMIGALVHRAEQKPESGEIFAIKRPVLEEVQSAYELRRMRHAIEAQRWLAGDWPQDLSGPDLTGLLGRETLAPDASPSYYYARRGDGIVLLSPER